MKDEVVASLPVSTTHCFLLNKSGRLRRNDELLAVLQLREDECIRTVMHRGERIPQNAYWMGESVQRWKGGHICFRLFIKF
jgi:hypothetical protein